MKDRIFLCKKWGADVMFGYDGWARGLSGGFLSIGGR
jgi:hypothetical protein